MSSGQPKWPESLAAKQDEMEATLEDVKDVLDDIKLKTDNLDVASSTLARKTAQDLMKTALDNIKGKTDNLDVASSTLARKTAQDLMKTALDNIKTDVDRLDILLSDSTFREFHDQIATTATSLTVDLTSDYSPASIRGQNFVVHNLGSADITVAIDGATAKTIRKYDVFLFDKTEWYVLVLSNPSGNDVEITIVGNVL